MTAKKEKTLAPNPKWQRVKDVLGSSLTYFCSSFTLLALLAIIFFVVFRGYKNFKWSFITGDYAAEVTTIGTDDSIAKTHNTTSFETHENEYFSPRWGIAFYQTNDAVGNPVTEISYVASEANVSNLIDQSTGAVYGLKPQSVITSLQLWTTADPDTAEVIVPDITDAKKVEEAFEKCEYLKTMTLQRGGQGMRGSLVSTLYLVLITMAVALPFGIGGAIYLGVYARKNKFTDIIRSMIDMVSGIPSVIFGLAGGLIFVPLFGGKNSLLAGSFTLACMILPVIIKSTEESIHTIPQSQSWASLALGASQTQTTFKIILPNALPGILTATLLGIGRVIGESAALIYTAGVAIQDLIIPTRGSASMAVHIWTLMSGENPNYDASCTVAMVILIFIFILDILIKIISYRINKRQKGN